VTKDELDAWMYQRGFRPLETLKSPKAPRRVSPEESARIWLSIKKRWEVLARIILEVRAEKITIEEARQKLNQIPESLAEEQWGRPDNATSEQPERHRPEDGKTTDPGVVH